MRRILLAAAIAAAAGAGPAMAQSETYELNIPAGDAGFALREFARQTGLQILYADSAIEGRTTPAIKGRFSIVEAERRLFEATGLALVAGGENTVFVRRQSPYVPADKLMAQTNAGFNGPASEEKNNQDVLEEVIVTAERRQTDVQKTAISITALSGEELSNRSINSIEAALRNVPAVEVQGSVQGGTIYMRGVGSAFNSQIGDPGVNLNVDGVYQQNTDTPFAMLTDINRIEVLRGPQGTLYGRNSTAGAVNVVSNDPSRVYEGAGKVEFGNYSLIHTEGMINAPVGDTLAVRLAFGSNRHEGYIQPAGYNDDDTIEARVKVLYAPSEKVRLLVTGDYIHIGGESFGTVPSPLSLHPDGNPWSSINRYGNDVIPGAADVKQWTLRAQLDWDLGIGVLTVMPSHTDYRKYASNLLILPTATSTNTNTATANGRNLGPNDQIEVRLASEADSRIKWVAGVYYLDMTESRLPDINRIGGLTGPNNVYPWNPATFPRSAAIVDINSKAVFGQLTYPLTNALRITGGLRYTADKKATYSLLNVNFDRGFQVGTDSKATTYKAGVEYDLGRDAMVYAQTTRGYKAATMDQATPQPHVATPEFVTAYEIGSKNTFWNNRLRVNGEAYYYDYKDYQASYAHTYCNTPIAPAAAIACATRFNSWVTNVNGGATIYGADLESSVLITRADRVDIGVAYNVSKFGNVLLDVGPDISNTTGLPIPTTYNSIANTRLPQAPTWSGSISYEHTFTLANGSAITAQADAHLSSGFWTNFTHFPADAFQPSYKKYNATLAYEPMSSKWRIGAYIKNIRNTPVRTNGLSSAENIQLQAPRTFGGYFAGKF